MKRIPVVLLLASIFGLSPAQDSLGDDLQSHYRTDFSIPDMPAFRALGTEPSEILRPADPKALALTLANEALNLGVIPKSFAAEFSPLRLIESRRMTVHQYRTKPRLYNTRVSVGTHVRDSSTGSTDVAVGLRTTLCDHGDMLNNRDFDASASRLLYLRTESPTNFVDTFLSRRQKKAADLELNPALSAQKDSFVQQQLALKASANDSIQALRERFKQSEWNQKTVDLAYAAKFESPDSMVGNLRIATHSFWATAAFPLGSLSQGLVGLRYSGAVEKTGWRSTGAIGLRIYGGDNNVKMFAEGQLTRAFAPDTTTWMANFGAEFLFAGGNWLEVTVAYDKEVGGGSRLVPGIKYHVTMPETSTK
jgi:hypothetical protein